MLSDTLLAVRLKHRMGTLELDVAFEAGGGWTVLFGPSGSGKSTVLRAVAGFVRPDEGRISVRTGTRQRVLVDTGTRRFLPAHKRGLRYAGQAAMLFPKMTVRENLMQAHVGPGREAWLESAIRHFGLGELERKMPGELSGGQRQMVSVVRAAVGEGEILLLDEPFSGLDGRLRDSLIGRLREWLGKTPVVSVTHDVGEAFLLGAEVVRMSEGRVVRQGAVEDVLGEERERLLGVLA
ncbi:ATP-binding cassette domain-containing protein [Granulicella tundricola]|uniref:ABC transporter related protein n=1 Tax=Granulicella tundricola (strain ATCC BAA-1859 / DSM 23138 / MP5ACTX9) TaxID=1198114 RepID=E8WZE3_GRATM|nr:ATP-binding cassette domain-containing protein [Granulicella tundricola]ADW68831.1 ABC transporter related protein [Granulicella tundricola MP5ACTX9]